ncbi:hypothetical protein B566_EDAN016910 [Ephemera danica]|nr:hypothetical protein B566_EDAN016910 [Ephemera danica]
MEQILYDSTAKVPEGVLSGNVYQFGSYDGCLGIDVQLPAADSDEGSSGFRGKYCLARVQFAPLVSTYPSFYAPSQHPYRMTFEANASAWEKIKYTGDRRKLRRDVIHWGVCVPSVCGTRHVTGALVAALRPLESRLGLRASVTLPDNMCTTRSAPRQLDLADVSFGLVLVVLVLVVIVCTTLEVIAIYKGDGKQSTSVGPRVIQAFSLRANWVALSRGPAARDAEAGDLRCIHGLRFFSMLLIILGHRCMFTFGGPLNNPESVEEIYTSAANMLLMNGPIIVDTFFVISGFLSCYLMLLELDKRKKLNVYSNLNDMIDCFIFVRFCFPVMKVFFNTIGEIFSPMLFRRLTPVYAVVVGFYATFIDQLGEGPLWTSKVGLERERCRTNWWTNLLYINNYVNPTQLCLFQSWFLACDMHYFLLAPLMVLTLWRWPRAGKALLVLATLLSVLVPFVVTLLGGLDAVLLLFMSTLADPVANETFRSVYIPSHTRAGPYFLGMLYGYSLATFLWFFLHAVALSSLFGAWAFYIPDIERSALERALYGGLHRAGWAVSLGWLIVACALGLSGNRLTYCAFLAHAGVQLYQSATVRSAEFMSYYKLFWMTSGDVTVTFGIALVLYLLFEAPVSMLEKIFIKKASPPSEVIPSHQQTLPTTCIAINQTWKK